MARPVTIDNHGNAMNAALYALPIRFVLIVCLALNIPACSAFKTTETAFPPVTNEGWQAVGTTTSSGRNPSVGLTDVLFAKDTTVLELLTAGTRETPRLQNIEQLGHSNYKSMLQDKFVIDETFIPFDDDSASLKTKEGSRISELVRRSDSKAVFRIVASSHGITEIENGNRVLADRRALRTVQQLVSAGVPVNNILPEACWSHAPAKDGHPDRGVLLTVYR